MQNSWQAQHLVNLHVQISGTALREPPCAAFVAGTALYEPLYADFVAGIAPCADFVAGIASMCRFRGRHSIL